MVHKIGSSEYKFVTKMSSFLPGFNDIFDEESFYIFMLFLLIVSIVLTIICAKHMKPLKDAGHIE